MKSVEFDIYVKGRGNSIKRSTTFYEKVTLTMIKRAASELAREGFLHNFDDNHYAFIPPQIIEEIHWEYQETNEG
jgi:hypothetical protein